VREIPWAFAFGLELGNCDAVGRSQCQRSRFSISGAYF
jgi:hypothetical protein